MRRPDPVLIKTCHAMLPPPCKSRLNCQQLIMILWLKGDLLYICHQIMCCFNVQQACQHGTQSSLPSCILLLSQAAPPDGAPSLRRVKIRVRPYLGHDRSTVKQRQPALRLLWGGDINDPLVTTIQPCWPKPKHTVTFCACIFSTHVAVGGALRVI